MCELFAFASREIRDITSELSEFYSHSQIHKDGFGFVNFTSGEFFRSKHPANENIRLQKVLSKGVKSSLFMGHIRKATHGASKLCNCHPFVRADRMGVSWYMCHNGFVDTEGILDTYKIKGETDSERLLCHLITHVNIVRDRDTAVVNFLREVKKLGKLNLVVYNEDKFYIFSNRVNNVYLRTEGFSVTVSTEPLHQHGWWPQKSGQLLIFDSYGTLIKDIMV